MLGGKHYHIRVTFDDGVLWVARIARENASSLPAAHCKAVLLSEAATLQFLGRTHIPVPAIHDFAAEVPDNPVGLGCILMDHARGNPLRLPSATCEQQRKVLEHFADIFLELEKYPFSVIGSLSLPGTDILGGCTNEDMADVDMDGDLIPFGPFSDTAIYPNAKINLSHKLIQRGEVYPHNPIDGYLVHRYLSDTLVSTVPVTGRELFYLKHMDDKGDHILVDEDFNITAIIDWEWAQTTSKAEAFCMPLFLLDTPSFHNGDNGLKTYEQIFIKILEKRSRNDLAAFVRDGRYQHCILFSIGGDVEEVSFKQLFEGLLKLQLGQAQKSIGWDEWRSGALAKYAGETNLIQLMEERMRHGLENPDIVR